MNSIFHNLPCDIHHNILLSCESSLNHFNNASPSIASQLSNQLHKYNGSCDFDPNFVPASWAGIFALPAPDPNAADNSDENDLKRKNHLAAILQQLTLECKKSALPPADMLHTIYLTLLRQVFAYADPVVSPKDKEGLANLSELFCFVDQHIPALEKEDPTLALKLKLQFANLPAPMARTEFPNLLLTEREKLKLLLDKLQGRENDLLSALIGFLETNRPDPEEAFYIAKLASEKSPLPYDSRASLRSVIGESLDWENVASIRDHIMRNKGIACEYSNYQALYRISKVRQFFEAQKDLPEEQVFIPRWFHATKLKNFVPILQSGKLEVRGDAIRGVWVSSQREVAFGKYAFGMSNAIFDIDQEPYMIPSLHRWISLHKDIPLKYRRCLGVVSSPKGEKVQKLEVVRSLQENGLGYVKVVSEVQLDCIQREVANALGFPDLPDLWWGLRPFYLTHQKRLGEQAVALASDPALPKLLQDKSQASISQLVQKLALPFYKKMMPSFPTYLPEGSTKRQDLKSTPPYMGKFADVARKRTTARSIHDTMHSAETTLWVQLLRLVCVKFGMSDAICPVLLALAAALHDAARENEGPDLWDGESAKLLEIILRRLGVPEDQIAIYVQAIAEKDSKNKQFTTLAQMLVQGGDCLEIMRLTGLSGFDPSYFALYQSRPEMREFLDIIIREVSLFIKLTNNPKVRCLFEHESADFYADLVRLLFVLQEKDPERFPEITALLQPEMQDILQVKQNAITTKAILLLTTC